MRKTKGGGFDKPNPIMETESLLVTPTSERIMAAEKTPEQEPSIEEILASIRQIISDDEDKDGDAPVAAEPPPAPEPVFEPAPVVQEPEIGEEEDDVLELTDPIVEKAPAPIEIDLQEFAQPPPPPAPKEVEMEEPKQKAPPAESILTESAREATLSSMAKLAGNMPITRHREYGNITLEDLVREMLHPMLRDWLSDNLPPMVERMVQKELEKLARQAQDV